MNLSDLWNTLAHKFAFGQDALKGAANQGQQGPPQQAPPPSPQQQNTDYLKQQIEQQMKQMPQSVQDANKPAPAKAPPKPTHKNITDTHTQLLHQHGQQLDALTNLFQQMLSSGGTPQGPQGPQAPQPPRPMQMNAPGIGIGT